VGDLAWGRAPAVLSGRQRRYTSLSAEHRAVAAAAARRQYVMQPETSPNPALPSFTEAVATFATFLEREGAPAQLLWVDREDVTSFKRQVWIRVGHAVEAVARAAARYEAGRERGLGVALRAVCKVGACTACYVWVPNDKTDAAYAVQPRSLKCSVPVPFISAFVVRSTTYWQLRRAFNGWRQFGNTLVSELPDRRATIAQATNAVDRAGG
jgi:hypothetical protein